MASNDDDDVGDAVPAAFVAVAARRIRDAVPEAFSLESLRGRAVVVIANGFRYEGLLIGADEDDLYLRGELRYLVLPLSTVSSIVPRPTPPAPLGGWPAAKEGEVGQGSSGEGKDDDSGKGRS